MSDIPPGPIDHILKRLPVKDILKFRSVSKPWCALIDSPFFIKLHLDQSLKTCESLTVILGGWTPFYSINLDSHENPVPLTTPFNSLGARLLGSCNGLLCLGKGVLNREIFFWNPSTRNYKVILAMPMYFSPGSVYKFFLDKLGYDHVNDDYKVVRLFQSYGSESNLVDSKVIVYSRNLNAWKVLQQDFPYHVCFKRGHGLFGSRSMSHGVTVGGSMHWVVTQKLELNLRFLIAAFDLCTQEFRLVPHPECPQNNYAALDVAVLGGCLSAIGNLLVLSVDIWVMRTYGVKESWSKMLSVSIIGMMTTPLPCVRPVAYSTTDEKKVLLEIENKYLVWYELEKKTARNVELDDMGYFSTHVYRESLV